MCTDASTLRLRALLMQCDERDKNHVIAYAAHLIRQKPITL